MIFYDFFLALIFGTTCLQVHYRARIESSNKSTGTRSQEKHSILLPEPECSSSPGPYLLSASTASSSLTAASDSVSGSGPKRRAADVVVPGFIPDGATTAGSAWLKGHAWVCEALFRLGRGGVVGAESMVSPPLGSAPAMSSAKVIVYERNEGSSPRRTCMARCSSKSGEVCCSASNQGEGGRLNT